MRCFLSTSISVMEIQGNEEPKRTNFLVTLVHRRISLEDFKGNKI